MGGLVGTVFSAFGWPTSIWTLAAYRELRLVPGLERSVALTIGSGVAATLLAFGGAVVIVATTHGRRLARAQLAVLPALLAVPHLASAVGTAFLLAPSGWLARLISPWLTGWERPPDLVTVNDPWGVTLTLGLALRECPFLILAILAAQSQLDTARYLTIARTLGYGNAEAWVKLALPVLYRQVRLPLYAVIAFALSVVDMALVLGPSTPPTFAVWLLRWLQDSEPNWNRIGAAGALLQLALIALVIVAWRVGELCVEQVSRRWLVAGPSRPLERALGLLALPARLLVFGLGLSGLIVLLLWSFAGTWRFPASWPQDLALTSWNWAGLRLLGPAGITLLVGMLAATIALATVVGCLEHESRVGTRNEARVLALAYLPLMVPQISFLFGLQVLFVGLGLDATLPGLVWAHLIFVLPYIVLMLRGPYLALNHQYVAASLALGSSSAKTFLRVRLPLLRRPLLVALAVGFTVSVAQYLPTVFVGAGRFPTLTTEALGLAIGGDRRLAAVAGLLLAALPLLALAAALAVPSPRLGRYHR